MLAALRDMVEATCRAQTNRFGYDIWTHHIVWVVLERSWQKLCPEARQILQDKYLAAQSLLDGSGAVPHRWAATNTQINCR